MSLITFTVLGVPVPQGSMKAFHRPGMRHPIVTSDNRALKPWRQEIAATAISLGREPFPQHVPVEISMNFYFVKPKSVKRNAVTVRPDIDKICRSFLDAITGILISDDAQVIEMHARKHYGGPPRVEIQIGEAIV